MFYEEECAVEVQVYFGYCEDGSRDVRCDRRYADGKTVYNQSWAKTVIDEFTVIHDLRAVNRFPD